LNRTDIRRTELKAEACRSGNDVVCGVQTASEVPMVSLDKARPAPLKEFSDQQLNERVMPPPFMGPSASRL
jgi:hypothetical protein